MATSSYPEHLKQTIFLGTPLVISSLSHIIVGLSDNIMVGRQSSVELAAVAFGNNVFNVFLILFIGISTGVTPLISSHNHPRRHRRIKGFFVNSLAINIISSLVLFGLILGSTPFLYLLRPPADIMPTLKLYYPIIGASLIPLAFAFSYKQLAEGLGDTNGPMIMLITSALVNVGLNYILIYGKFGFPALGGVGAGIATLLSRVIYMVLMWLYVYVAKRRQFYLTLSQKPLLSHIKPHILGKLLNLSLPIAMQMSFEVNIFVVAAVFASWFGTSALAAHQIALTMAGTSFMVCVGIAGAVSIRVGTFFGDADKLNIRRASRVGVWLVAAVMCSFALAYGTFGRQLVGLFTTDTNVIELAVPVMVVAALYQIFDGVQVLYINVLRGMQDVKVPMYITFICYWPIGLTACLLLGFYFSLGIMGIWIGLSLALAFAAILLLYRYLKIYQNFNSSVLQ